jgi:GTP-binding protein HflX
MSQLENKVEEKLILFVAQKKRHLENEAWESLDELEELVQTAGGTTLIKILQRVESFNPAHYIGSGKVQEIKEMIEQYGATGVVCDDELSPVQMKNLTLLLDTKVMDRTMVILDIFAQRARSREGKLQVEMAQLKYQYSRLSGFGEALSRQGGGIGTRGPGEKKLENDKRHIRARMDLLKKEIEEMEKHRSILRSKRQKNKVPVVAIVGYTNAGKSTLLNTLSGSDVYVKNQLFATLDPTTRGVVLPSGTEIMVTDTVGFIRKLPHHLIKAFYSTLEEARYADIILHVIDISSPHILTHKEVVQQTLDMLNIKEIPILNVYNKIDEFMPEVGIDLNAPDTLGISAKEGENINSLLEKIEEILYQEMKKFKVFIPYHLAEILTYCHQNGERLEEEYANEGIYLSGYIHRDKYYRLEPFIRD